VIATVNGNMSPAANNEYIAPLPRKWYLASTKLTMSPSATTPKVVTRPTIAEFPISRQKVEPVSTST